MQYVMEPRNIDYISQLETIILFNKPTLVTLNINHWVLCFKQLVSPCNYNQSPGHVCDVEQLKVLRTSLYTVVEYNHQDWEINTGEKVLISSHSQIREACLVMLVVVHVSIVTCYLQHWWWSDDLHQVCFSYWTRYNNLFTNLWIMPLRYPTSS